MKSRNTTTTFNTRSIILALVAIVAISLAAVDRAAAMPPSDKLMPETTSGYFSITNINTLKAKWAKTQLGQLFHDDVMDPFIEDLSEQFNEKLTKLTTRVGLKVDDFLDVASGEIAAGYANMSEDSSAIMVLIDVTGNVQKATALLKKVSDRLIEEDATRETLDGPEGSETKIIRFKLPPVKIQPKNGDAPVAVQYYVYYFIDVKEEVLCVTDDLEAARLLAGRLADPMNIDETKTLAGTADFQTVMERPRGLVPRFAGLSIRTNTSKRSILARPKRFARRRNRLRTSCGIRGLMA